MLKPADVFLSRAGVNNADEQANASQVQLACVGGAGCGSAPHAFPVIITCGAEDGFDENICCALLKCIETRLEYALLRQGVIDEGQASFAQAAFFSACAYTASIVEDRRLEGVSQNRVTCF
eukprot:CAMPEP_0119309458 /NCGR_PEP_ID=MMETSP1333-20130426/15768_1 /TAXON_ID=418940 /ORGANISM="Scyphosphaera apsteinii, Strain RCC1455" /LENGTH=120 /DNA_ID=CAMNT_0007313443 /DNA_START=667 /DNA_END=1029 /DNA_ORIENTATION=+